jgi:hypothetical protein
MAWVREKNPKRKVSAPQRDPKDALEGLLSYLACKPAPGINVQRYLRETRSPSPTKHEHDEKPDIVIVQREPTVYADDDEGEDDYEVESLRSQRTRSHHHRHERYEEEAPPPARRTPAPRHVSSGSGEGRPYRPRTTVQTRRVVSSWSNATTPLVI